MDFKSNVRLITKPGSLKAVADVSINDEFVVKGFRVMEGEKGLFVAMPSRKFGDTYEDTAFPITKEARESLLSSVLEAYDYKLNHKEEQKEEQKNEQEKGSKKGQKGNKRMSKENTNAEDMSEASDDIQAEAEQVDEPTLGM